MMIFGTALLAACMNVLSFLPDTAQENDEKFKLVKEDGEIRIYERWIFFPKSDPPVDAREVKGVFYAETTLNHAIGLLKDEARIGEWQSHVSKFKVYPHNDTSWYEYSYHDIPWPVSDQDHFLVYTIEARDQDKIFVTFESFENNKLAPKHEDAARMKLSGSWLFEKAQGRVKITYRILSMPSGIPRIFTDPVIRSNMMSTIKSYITIVEDDHAEKTR